jgi:hypothetical protein
VTGPSVGRVDGELRITTDKVDDDVHEGLEEAGKVGDKDMKKLGKDLGDTFDAELKKSTKDTGHDISAAISAGIEKGWKAKTIQLDADGNVVRAWLTRELAEGAKPSGETAGAIKKFGSVFTDAIGAGFNVSGKSPLIALLVPFIGFIGELVAGAIQIINGLVAVLAVIPNLIGAIILQVGVLFLAFKGLTTAIQGAFAAKNAEELEKALEGLTPSAKEFVRTLLPLREVFNELAAIAQESFFDRMAASIQRVVDALTPILRGGIGAIASGLGDVFRGVLNVLANPVFTSFLSELIPATVGWLQSFNSAFQDFLIGLANFGSAVMPFFSWLGESLNQALAEFGTWLGNLSVDPEFIQWLEDMKTNLTDGAEALGAIVGFIKEFVDALDDAGGNEALKDITAQFNELAKFLATDEGTKAMEGLLHVIQILAYFFIFLVNDIIIFLILVELTAEFIKNGLLPAIADFFTNTIPEFFTFVGEKIIEFKDFLISKFKEGLDKTIENMGVFLEGLIGFLLGFQLRIISFFLNLFLEIGRIVIEGLFAVAGAIATWIHDRAIELGNFFGSIPQMIADAVGGLEDMLFGQGQNLIKGLINGIISMSGPLGAVVARLLKERVKDQVPSSPAKTGPLSGKGDPLFGGQEISKRLAAGIEMEGPVIGAAANSAISNVNAAVNMNFYGPTPTTQQASSIGMAAGNSLADTIAQRNTRLAIRSIGSAAATA